jgi:site-specific DNA-methyltransferase (adenine-specific)
LNNALDALCGKKNKAITLTELRAIIDLKIFNLLRYQSTLESIVTLNHTALKPAWEPVCLARKPISERTVAANVLKWGTGAINVDGCRIPTDELKSGTYLRKHSDSIYNGETSGLTRAFEYDGSKGRWPANIIHDGSEEVIAAFPESKSGGNVVSPPSPKTAGIYGDYKRDEQRFHGHADDGSAARFFYTAKADSDDRLGSKHPTVKPVDLMQWLVRLVTPKGGLVLDPFAGTGTTAEACFREGMRCMMVERETEYQADIRRRMALALGGPEERRRESIKAKTKDQPIDHGPLFATIP